MKSYLIATGLLFGLLAFLHLLRTIMDWQRLTTDPGFIVQGPGVGLIALGLCIWAGRLLRISLRT